MLKKIVISFCLLFLGPSLIYAGNDFVCEDEDCLSVEPSKLAFEDYDPFENRLSPRLEKATDAEQGNTLGELGERDVDSVFDNNNDHRGSQVAIIGPKCFIDTYVEFKQELFSKLNEEGDDYARLANISNWLRQKAAEGCMIGKRFYDTYKLLVVMQRKVDLANTRFARDGDLYVLWINDALLRESLHKENLGITPFASKIIREAVSLRVEKMEAFFSDEQNRALAFFRKKAGYGALASIKEEAEVVKLTPMQSAALFVSGSFLPRDEGRSDDSSLVLKDLKDFKDFEDYKYFRNLKGLKEKIFPGICLDGYLITDCLILEIFRKLLHHDHYLKEPDLPGTSTYNYAKIAKNAVPVAAAVASTYLMHKDGRLYRWIKKQRHKIKRSLRRRAERSARRQRRDGPVDGLAEASAPLPSPPPPTIPPLQPEAPAWIGVVAGEAVVSLPPEARGNLLTAADDDLPLEAGAAAAEEEGDRENDTLRRVVEELIGYYRERSVVVRSVERVEEDLLVLKEFIKTVKESGKVEFARRIEMRPKNLERLIEGAKALRADLLVVYIELLGAFDLEE